MLFATVMVLGMSMPVYSTGTFPVTTSHGREGVFFPAAGLAAFVDQSPVVREAAALAFVMRDPILDDPSLDDNSEPRALSRSVEQSPFSAGFGGSARALGTDISGEGLATRAICCIWRC